MAVLAVCRDIKRQGEANYHEWLGRLSELGAYSAISGGTALGGWRIVWAWVLTIPASGIIAALIFWVMPG